VDDDKKRQILIRLSEDHVLAHDVLFRHRHPNATPEFHHDMIDVWHGQGQHEIFLVFRGGAKSTIAEEGICIDTSFRRFKNVLILGNNFDRAAERLHAIRHEFEQNEYLGELFGDQRGSIWGDEALELANGCYLQALGRGQSLRGIKHNSDRPDFLFWDDIEDKESVRTPEGRRKTNLWFLNDLLPAMNTDFHKTRGAATPLDPEALPMELSRPGTGFRPHVYPIEHLDAEGKRTPTWPDREPLDVIDQRIVRATNTGTLREYRMEYMCQAEAPEEKPFKQEMFRIEPQVRTWQAVYCMYDPARTVNRTSATTGFAAWSWFANRLVIWDAWARMLMPDEIIKHMFDFHEEFRPTVVGVEEDGLNEWLLQPIRHEQVRRGDMLPMTAVKAPKGKIDFIRGLQPFFTAREILFARQLPDLQSQLLAFPTGRIDCPNALAYALRMRPGAPVYDDFGNANVQEDLQSYGPSPIYLALNATSSMVTGVLCQFSDGVLRVLWDIAREGDPATVLPDLIREATQEAGQSIRLVAGPQHFDRYVNVGLLQAARRIPMEMRKGTTPDMGRTEIAGMMKRERRGAASFLVSDRARWTLNALAGGYARAMLKGGMLAPYAVENVYRHLMEGLEGYAGTLRLGSPDEERDDIQYATTPQGRRYVSALR
jgi:hypothetical protein